VSMQLKKIYNLNTLIGIIGLILAVCSILGTPDVLISLGLFIFGLILFLFALNRTLGEFGAPYKIQTFINEFTILDPGGKKVQMNVSSLVTVRRREVPIGGNACSFYPHNLKTFVSFFNQNIAPGSTKHEVAHSVPQKIGSKYAWEEYYKPPLKRGQKVWITNEFEVSDEFTTERNSDFFNSFRRVEKFVWKVHLPPQRPAKRWWGTADYLPNKPDNYILTECNKSTNEIEWIFTNTKKGAVYYIHWEW